MAKAPPDAGAHAGFRNLMLLAIAFGVLGAAAEIALLAAKQHLLQRFIAVSWMVLWMTPIANVVLLAVIALIATALAAALRRPAMAGRLGVFGMAWLTLLSPLLLFSQLHALAAVLLAAGAAAQVARFLARHWESAMRVVRASLPFLVLAPTIGAAGLHGNRRIAEWRMLA